MLNRILYQLKTLLSANGAGVLVLFGAILVLFVGPWLTYMDSAWEGYTVPEGQDWVVAATILSVFLALAFSYYLLYRVRKSTPPDKKQ